MKLSQCKILFICQSHKQKNPTLYVLFFLDRSAVLPTRYTPVLVPVQLQRQKKL